MVYILPAKYALPKPKPVFILPAKYALPEPKQFCTANELEKPEGEQTIPTIEQEAEKVEINSDLKKLFMMFSKPTMAMSMHFRPLYVTARLNGQNVNKIMVAQGTAENIITLRTMTLLGIQKTSIMNTTMKVKDFAGSTTKTLGIIFLKVQLGPAEAVHSFFVVECTGPYNVILGRDWIHQSSCIPSSLHQELLMWNPVTDEAELIKADPRPFSVSANAKMIRENGSPSSQKKIQKEWSCPLCQITTTSENCLKMPFQASEDCLKMHFQGKKHALKVEALQGVKQGPISEYKSSEKLKRRTKRRVLLDNYDPIARPNQEKWSDLPRLCEWECPLDGWTSRLCRWEKPQVEWTKLNTDGSTELGNAGIGGLFRNYKGEPICAFVSKGLADDIFMVELCAILRGLVIASSLGIKLLWVESDSLAVVKTINREQPHSSKACSILKSIWKILKKFDKHCVSHTWRETNRAADHLAKMVVPKRDVVFWPDDFPDSLNRIIKEDAKGTIYCRGKIDLIIDTIFI
uniref:uncharacterized protein LOC105353254 n=1 Tax=Fragaria vesca subsp. vesca TaxID=101020 RepID=UPI0005C8EEB6|nr:PREDICTED: uncharacterized protein LOC105353254 [Fragaria vesca subsp. vesca]